MSRTCIEVDVVRTHTRDCTSWKHDYLHLSSLLPIISKETDLQCILNGNVLRDNLINLDVCIAR